MSAKPVQLPGKKGGKRPFFSERIEDEIARRYYIVGETSRELAKEFAPLAPGAKLSEAGIRVIARRSRERTEKARIDSEQAASAQDAA